MTYDLSARDLLNRLIAFPTVSADTNLPLIEFVEQYLAAHGIDSTRCPHPSAPKAGLVAQVGPSVAGGVVLSGHTDVVPIIGQAWDTDPWTVTEKDGKLFGRGTCDMKGFVALALHAMVKARGRRLKRPLQIALSRDEELGLLGATDVAQALLDGYPKASAVIVGEPTQMRLVNGHKSCEGVHVNITGHEVHSSNLFEGASAIFAASQIVEWARQASLANAAARPTDMAALYDPPYTTLHVGKIEGGTAANITARHCAFTLDIRCVGDDCLENWLSPLRDLTRRIEADMQKISPDCKIDITTIPGPGVRPENSGAAEALVRGLTGDNATHTVSYGTDGGHFQRLGFSTVICGPGSIEQAHKPNEYIAVSEFEAGGAMLDRLIDTLS